MISRLFIDGEPDDRMKDSLARYIENQWRYRSLDGVTVERIRMAYEAGYDQAVINCSVDQLD